MSQIVAPIRSRGRRSHWVAPVVLLVVAAAVALVITSAPGGGASHPRSERRAHPARRHGRRRASYWTVRPGDTLAQISAKTGVRSAGLRPITQTRTRRRSRSASGCGCGRIHRRQRSGQPNPNRPDHCSGRYDPASPTVQSRPRPGSTSPAWSSSTRGCRRPRCSPAIRSGCGPRPPSSGQRCWRGCS